MINKNGNLAKRIIGITKEIKSAYETGVADTLELVAQDFLEGKIKDITYFTEKSKQINNEVEKL